MQRHDVVVRHIVVQQRPQQGPHTIERPEDAQPAASPSVVVDIRNQRIGQAVEDPPAETDHEHRPVQQLDLQCVGQPFQADQREQRTDDQQPLVAKPVHHRSEKHRTEDDPDGHRGRQCRRPFHPGVELSQDRPERKHGHTEEGQPGARRHEYLVCFIIHRRMFFRWLFSFVMQNARLPYSLMLRRARYPAPISTASPPSIEGTISTFWMAIGCAWRTAACLIRSRN